MITVDQLLAAADSEPPSGPNLEYDDDFRAMEVAARGKPEQELGERKIAAVPPDWAEVRTRAARLLGRSKDIRPAMYITRAELAEEGLAGFRRGVNLMHALVDRYWESVHPQLEPDDGDATARLNALAGLIDPGTTLSEVRQAVIVEVPRKGRVTVRDILLATGRLQPGAGESGRSLDEIQGFLASTATDRGDVLASARDAAASVQAFYKVVADKVGTERAPDVKPLRDLLQPVAEVCARALGDAAPDAVAGEAAAAGPASGEIRSRDEALRQLDRVCAYMERTEPASPAPLLIRRAQRLMRKNFVEIIEDLTPESLTAIKSIAGIKDET